MNTSLQRNVIVLPRVSAAGLRGGFRISAGNYMDFPIHICLCHVNSICSDAIYLIKHHAKVHENSEPDRQNSEM